MAENLHITSRITIPAHELRFSFSRSSGPGGQKVNKTSSRATLHWAIDESILSEDLRARVYRRYASRIGRDGDLSISSEKHRLQSRNREECLEKLREIIRSVLQKPKPRLATRATKSSVERRLTGKKKQSQRKTLRRRTPSSDD